MQAQAEACGYRLTAFLRTPDIRIGIDTGGTFTEFVFLGADGRVLKPLTDEEITGVRRWVQETAPEALAIVLLHSYAHPDHEERLAAALADLNLPMSLSSRMLPEFREYERTSATVLNAYLGPVLGAYLTDWSRRWPGPGVTEQKIEFRYHLA